MLQVTQEISKQIDKQNDRLQVAKNTILYDNNCTLFSLHWYQCCCYYRSFCSKLCDILSAIQVTSMQLWNTFLYILLFTTVDNMPCGSIPVKCHLLMMKPGYNWWLSKIDIVKIFFLQFCCVSLCHCTSFDILCGAICNEITWVKETPCME